MLLSDSILESIGITYYPNRQVMIMMVVHNIVSHPLTLAFNMKILGSDTTMVDFRTDTFYPHDCYWIEYVS